MYKDHILPPPPLSPLSFSCLFLPILFLGFFPCFFHIIIIIIILIIINNIVFSSCFFQSFCVLCCFNRHHFPQSSPAASTMAIVFVKIVVVIRRLSFVLVRSSLDLGSSFSATDSLLRNESRPWPPGSGISNDNNQ